MPPFVFLGKKKIAIATVPAPVAPAPVATPVMCGSCRGTGSLHPFASRPSSILDSRAMQYYQAGCPNCKGRGTMD